MLLSREERERRQRQRAKKSRSQLLGPVAQGGRRPMQQGYTTTKVEPPKFRQSTAGDDLTTAGLAYKGGKGIFDFTQGKEAYTDAAGNVIPKREPWTIGGESIGDKLSGYGDKLSGYADQTGEALTGLFSSPNPTAAASSYAHAVPGSQFANEAAAKAAFMANPEAQMMMKSGLIDAGAGAGGWGGQGMITQGGNIGQGGFLQSGIGQGMGNAVSASSVGSNIPYGSGSAFQGANAANTASTAAKASSGLQGADAASGASGASGQPWLAYANIAKDLFVGGPGSEKITGSTAGDAVIRAAAAYYTFGMSEIAYGLF